MIRINQAVTYALKGSIALVEVSNPPVNAINQAMRIGLAEALVKALADDQAGAVLLTSLGNHFMAGVDISEFSGAVEGAALQEIQTAIENADKPVVAALQGMALGGGLELAMACHYRVADAQASLGLPEITLGLIPGAGGTQRLPRLIGALPALNMMLTGKPMDVAEAMQAGLVDERVNGDLLETALAFCQGLLDQGKGPRPTGGMPVDSTGFDQAAIDRLLADNARALRGRSTHHLLIEALIAAVEQPFWQGLRTEARLAEDSLAATESKALRYLFFAERHTGKLSTGVAPLWGDRKPTRAAVIGAGTMGSGIATALANVGVQVALVDNSEAGLQRGLGQVQDNYALHRQRGRITQEQVEQRLALIQGSTELETVAGAEFVVEAVFEDMAAKKQVIEALDELLPPDRLIATNTSSLSVSSMAVVARHPGRIAGLHFFSPAHIMKLVEVIRGESTSEKALAAALQVAKLLKKVPVLCGDAYGFIGNKMMLDGYFREAELLLLEGATPEQVDRAMEDFGFAMGPQRVSDLGGTDVGTKARRELYKREPREAPYFVIADKLTELGRLGQKTGAGFYRYEAGSHQALPDPEVLPIIRAQAEQYAIRERTDISDEEIRERCILSLINVGAKVLESGVAQRAADIDVVWTSGYGFPRFKGGPMFYADTLGLKHVVERLEHYHERLGHYWEPSGLIQKLAARNGRFQEWDQQREING